MKDVKPEQTPDNAKIERYKLKDDLLPIEDSKKQSFNLILWWFLASFCFGICLAIYKDWDRVVRIFNSIF